MAVIGNEDHKQRVNLSSFARSVIELDRGVFDDGGSLSGFLNRIITEFRDTADASIDLSAEERQRQLIASGYTPDVAARLADEHRQQLIEKASTYPQGDSLIFRLNNQNFYLLYEELAESTAYTAPSKYLKALLEEYSRLSPSKRESIYYAPLILRQLEPAIDAGYALEFRVNGTDFRVRPHSIMADPFNSHLYLVGFSAKLGSPDATEAIASFRITRMERVKQKKQNGRLSADEKRMIEKKLQQVGVQYLVGNIDHIRIRLTESGRRLFMQRNYMRPVPEKIEGDIYHFSCSTLQIKNFFVSFGKDAQILEPLSLRDEFAQIYREAAESYR